MATQPDAVILTGDIGETSSDWVSAKNALGSLKAPVYFVPGNHDIHTTNISTYRQYFGNDYYSFKINNITFMAVDSQLLGDFDTFTSGQTPANVQPLPSGVQTESDSMLAWLARQTAVANEIAVQHVPLFPQGSGTSTYPSTNPYWAIYDVQNDTNIHHQYRTEEVNALNALGIHTMLAGHWHNQRNFSATQGSFTLNLHMGPAVAYAIGTGASVGYTVHTISSTGSVTTQMVACTSCL
jgi:hypothetical protein